jgi:DNA-binding transcriptional regulator YiaG
MSNLPQNTAFEIFGVHSVPFISDQHKPSTSQFTYGRTIPEQCWQPMPQTVGTVLLALFIGSGAPPQGNISLIEISPLSQIQTARPAAQQIYAADVSDILATIRTAFPLQISQIAEILGVSRPTVYAWIRDEQQPQPRCQERLNQIYALAEFWNARCNQPVPEKTLELPDSAGVSLIDMLKEEVLNTMALQSRLTGLYTDLRSHPKPERITDLARKYGIDISRNRDNTAEFDVITRRPMDES